MDKSETRLEQLKNTKFLSHRIFPRISENISYEIFKYMNFQELLQIRDSNLGGFQLVSNTTLRSRIKNYLKGKALSSLTDLFANKGKINLLFEQKGERVLSIKSLRNWGVKLLTENLKFIPNLQSFYLSNILCINY